MPYKKQILILVILQCLVSNLHAKTVAILEFEDLSTPPNPAGLQISHDLITYSLSKEFNIIDQEIVKKVFDLPALKKMGIINKDKAYSLGKLLDADILVVGNYQILKNDSVLINTSFISTHYDEIPEIDNRILACFERIFSLEGRVKDISKDGIFIDIGSTSGLRVGDNLFIIRDNTAIGNVKIVKLDKEYSEIVPITDVKITVGDKVRKYPFDFKAKTTRHLIVSPTPSAQKIEINGKSIGFSPLVVKNLQDKKIILTISKPGYKSILADINFYDYPMLNISLALFKSVEEELRPAGLGSVLITSSPSSAYVYLGKQLKGMTPLLIPNLPTGMYQISIGKPGHETVDRKVIIDGVGQKRLDVKLKFIIPPLPPKEPPLELLTVQTPQLLKKDEIDIGLKYPEGFILRLSPPIENLELRIHGLGIGVKNKLVKNLALDSYYQVYDMREHKKEKSSGISLLLGAPIELPFGYSEYYLGAGLVRKNGHNKLRYSGGVMSQLTREFFLLLEYDKIDGYGVGIRFPLTPKFEFLCGLGKENGDFRYDVGIFFRGEVESE
ncbi:MAG: PEGA domain-containing protein [bacterium]